jgi:RimJ/RimL family protein N-acetyltransferase
VPAVLVTLNRNQRRLADGVVAAGAAISVGEPVAAAAGEAAARLAELAGDTARRTEMAMAGQGLVDGRGAERVVAHLRAALLQLRPVDARDAELLFEWANDPTTRAASFTTSAIGWDDHRAWLEARLRNPAATQWIGSFSGAPVGLVRFDRLDDGTAEIGVTVAPSQRGRGWGPALIDAGCDRMFATGSVTAILARIKPDNDASVSSFIAANFNPLEHREEPWLELERRYGGA